MRYLLYIRSMSELSIVLLIIVTLIFIGFFAGYEIAFISANRLGIELKKKQGKNSGIILSGFLEQQAKFLGTCLIGLNLFLVTYGLLFDEFLNQIAWNPFHFNNAYVKLIVDTICSTLVVLIFGEFLPKAIFRAKSDTLLATFAPLASLFHKLFQPFADFFVGTAQWILKYLFNLPVKDKDLAFSKVDLEHFFQQTKEQDEDNPELNKELFENALSLPMVKIRQCLVPRTEIEAVEIGSTIEEVKKHFVHTKLSKLIVFNENIDDIINKITKKINPVKKSKLRNNSANKKSKKN